MTYKNLDIHETAAGTFVRSPKGSWWIQEGRGKYILMHQNLGGATGTLKTQYHSQNKSFKNIEDAYEYILKHDNIRYSGHERTDRIYKAMKDNMVFICVHDLRTQITYTLKMKNGLKPAMILEELRNQNRDEKHFQVYVKSVLNNRRNNRSVSSVEELTLALKGVA